MFTKGHTYLNKPEAAGLFNTFTAKVFSERRLFMHLSKHVFGTAAGIEFLDIQANIECRFTLKRVRDRIRRYSHGFWESITSEILEL